MKRLSILILAAMLAVACKKDKPSPQLTGTYTGSFRSTSDAAATQPGPFAVQLIISGNNFKSGQGSNVLTVGAGALKVNTNILNFTNEEMFPDNTSVNSVAVLNNSYSYTIKGDSLLFSKTVLNVTYTYKFKKQ